MEITGAGIAEFFEADHRRLDGIVAGFSRASLKEKRARLEEFDAGLERHIRWEEELLFPAVGAKQPGIAQGPIPVMLLEHEEIRRHKADALKALRAGDEAASEAALRQMFHVLSHHNAKEEQILYPACDELLSPAEAEAILAKTRGATAPKGSGGGA